MKITDLTNRVVVEPELKKVPIKLVSCLQSCPDEDGKAYFENSNYDSCFKNFDEVIRVSKNAYKGLDLVILKRDYYEAHFLAEWNDGVLP